MPTNLSVNINVSMISEFVNSLDVGSVKYPFKFSSNNQFSNGVGANQANEIFTDTRTLAASGTEDLDLSGVLLNAFGSTIAFDRIKAMMVTASPSNTNDVLVGGHATLAVESFFGDASDTIRVKPGGTVALIAPDVNGYTVADGVDDMLTITNSSGGTGVTYTILLIGTV